MPNTPVLWRNFANSPFREFSGFNKVMDRMMEDFNARRPLTSGTDGFAPLCEIKEDKTAFYFKFEMPGIPKDQIKINLEENLLTVSGERKEEKKEEDKYHRTSEFSYGSYTRSFAFPSPVDAEKSMATYDHGILSLTVPKATSTRSRQITIK